LGYLGGLWPINLVGCKFGWFWACNFVCKMSLFIWTALKRLKSLKNKNKKLIDVVGRELAF